MKTALTALLLVITFNFCISQQEFRNNNYTDTINVALFPYVPRLDQFKTELRKHWNKQHPTCMLNVVDWDAYSDDPDNNLDVFVFDNIFMTYFIERGFLMKLDKKDIDNIADFIPYAIEGCKDKPEGTGYYGLPQIGCTNMLYYRKKDKALERAQTYTELCAVLGISPDTAVIPPLNEGLLIDLSDNTMDACMYLDFSMDNGVPYSWNPPLPAADSLSGDLLHQMHKLVSAGGLKQVSYEESVAYERGIWFNEQRGRAMVNFTEAMSVMTPETLKKIRFKIMPFSDQKGIHVFYTDVVGINSLLEQQPAKKQLAIDLANLLSSSDYMTACLAPEKEGDSPQYLMPVRKSVFDKLSKNWPMYRKMFTLIRTAHPLPFRLGPDSREWLNENGEQIGQQIRKTE